ncbi:MAG: RecX family transcriptional regulator [Ichthyobacteriaceae bacterium]|nr:RecX family transcriptional regulator [Ichthyobacteriaceae bacterium]
MDKKEKTYTVQEIKSKLEYYCAYQDRSHYDVEQKLREFNVIEEARDLIILSLIEEKYLDEERFAKSYARGKFYHKNWGKLKIAQGLKQKYISEYLISSALKEIENNDYFNTINKLIENKIKTTNAKSSYDLKAKIIRYLQGKGYEYSIIIDEIDNLLQQ